MIRQGSRANWLHEAKWGVFMHFLPGIPGGQPADQDAEDWNRRVDAFDVQGLVRQLRDAKAGYFVLALGQNSGHYCAPNPTYDRIAGIRPSKCARRDVVAELHEALAPHGIRLMVYLPSGAPALDPEAVAKLEWTKGGRCVAFQRKWEAVIREWSLRWGPKVSGWWFDGCYYTDDMYRHADEPNFSSFAAAVRAGNPDSLVAWNPGVVYPPFTVDEEEDYTAGEVNDPRRVDAPGRWVRQAQFHILTYLGKNWAQPEIRFSAAEAVAHTLAFTNYGGVVTWDAPLTYEGLITPEALTVLNEVGQAVDSTRGAPDRIAPRVVRPSVALIEAPQWGNKDRSRGRVQVSLTNNWNEPIRGRVSLSLDPVSSGRMEGQGSIDYDLQPGATAKAEVRFRAGEVPVTGVPVRLVLNRTGIERPLVYPLSERERIRLPRLAIVPSFEDLGDAMTDIPARTVVTGQGQALADIKLAVADGQLAIFCEVSDAIMRQSDDIWDGSCMEVFGVADAGDPINQLFFVPAVATAPARAMQLARTEGSRKTAILPVSGPRFASWANPAGYTSVALIPLSWWLKRPVSPGGFLMEIVITAGVDVRNFERVSLFGSTDAPTGTDGYAECECGG